MFDLAVDILQTSTLVLNDEGQNTIQYWSRVVNLSQTEPPAGQEQYICPNLDKK